MTADPTLYIADLSDPDMLIKLVNMNGLWDNTSVFGLIDGSLNFGVPSDLTQEFVDMQFALFTEGASYWEIQHAVSRLNTALEAGGVIVWEAAPPAVQNIETVYIDFDPSPPVTLFRGQDRVLWKVLGLNQDTDGILVTVRRRRKMRTAALASNLNLLVNSTWMEDRNLDGRPDVCAWSNSATISLEKINATYKSYEFNFNTTDSNEHFFSEEVAITGGQPYTYSLEQAFEGDPSRLPLIGVRMTFMPGGETYRTQNAAIVPAEVGFTRVSVTATAPAGATSVLAGLYVQVQSGRLGGLLNSRFPQLENTASASPYRVGVQIATNDITAYNGKHVWAYTPGNTDSRMQLRLTGATGSDITDLWLTRRSTYHNSVELANHWLGGRVTDAGTFVNDTTNDVDDTDATGAKATITEFSNAMMRKRWRVEVLPDDPTTVEGTASLFIAVRGIGGGSHDAQAEVGEDTSPLAGVRLQACDISGNNGNTIPTSRFDGLDIVMIKLYPRDSGLHGGTWSKRCYEVALKAGVPIIGFYSSDSTPHWNTGGTAATKDAMLFCLGDPSDETVLKSFPYAVDGPEFFTPSEAGAQIAAAQAFGMKVGFYGADGNYSTYDALGQDWLWIAKVGSGCNTPGNEPVNYPNYTLWQNRWYKDNPCDGLYDHDVSATGLDRQGFLDIATAPASGEDTPSPHVYRIKFRYGYGDIDNLPYGTATIDLDLSDEVTSEYQVIEVANISVPKNAQGLYLEGWAESTDGKGTLYWDQWWLDSVGEGYKLHAELPGDFSNNNSPSHTAGKYLLTAPTQAEPDALPGTIHADEMLLRNNHESACSKPTSGQELESGVAHTIVAQCTVFNAKELDGAILGQLRVFNMTTGQRVASVSIKSHGADRWSSGQFKVKITPNAGEFYVYYVIMTRLSGYGNIHVTWLEDDFTPSIEGGLENMSLDGDVQEAYVGRDGHRGISLVMAGQFPEVGAGTLTLIPIWVGEQQGDGTPFPKHVASRIFTVETNVFPAYD